MCVKKGIKALALVLLVQLALTNCSGGHMANNGIFEKGHKELKEALVGSWRIVKTDGELIGEELYEFFKEEKEVSLKVNGVERAIERFDSSDGLSFTFEYVNGDEKKVFVVGQFKSSARSVLMLIEEPTDLESGGLHSSLTLERRSKQTETVVAKSGN